MADKDVKETMEDLERQIHAVLSDPERTEEHENEIAVLQEDLERLRAQYPELAV